MAKNKKSKNIPLPILILICAALVFDVQSLYAGAGNLGRYRHGTDSYESRPDDTNRSQIAHEPFPYIGL